MTGQLAISGGAQLPVPPVGLGGKTQAPQSVSRSPQPQVRPVESPSQDIPPINPEDLTKLGVDAQLIPFIVSTILRAEQSPSVSPPLSTAEAEKLVEILDKVWSTTCTLPCLKFHDDQVVSSLTASPNMKNRCFRILRRVSPTYGILPNSYFLPGVTLIDNVPHAVGGFVDIWKGQRDGNQVCVKALRTQTTVNLEKIKRVCGNSLFHREGGLSLVPIRGSTATSWGGSTFRTRMSCPSSESRRLCSRFASSALGCQAETFLSTSENIGGSIDCSW